MPASGRKTDYLILLTLGVVATVVILLLVSAGTLRRDEPFLPIRTTHSASRDGALAVYMLFERFGIDVRRSERPLLGKALERTDVLLILDPILSPEEGEEEELRQWVRRGGVLVTSSSDSLLASVRAGGRVWDGDASGAAAEDDGTATAADTTVSPVESGMPLARDVSSVDLATLAVIDVHDGVVTEVTEPGTPLLADGAGVRVVSHAVGDGWIVVLADTSFLANGRIGNADNAILAINLLAYALDNARGERVAFDEYHFGFGTRPSGWSLLGTGILRTSLGWSVLCLVAAGVLYIVYRGRRFGTRYPVTRTRRRTKLEYVHSVGATYRAAGAHGLTLQTIYTWFRSRVAAAVGLPPSASIEALADAVARRTSHGPCHYEQLFRRCEEVQAERRVSARRATALLSQLARIESEVLDGHRTRH